MSRHRRIVYITACLATIVVLMDGGCSSDRSRRSRATGREASSGQQRKGDDKGDDASDAPTSQEIAPRRFTGESDNGGRNSAWTPRHLATVRQVLPLVDLSGRINALQGELVDFHVNVTRDALVGQFDGHEWTINADSDIVALGQWFFITELGSLTTFDLETGAVKARYADIGGALELLEKVGVALTDGDLGRLRALSCADIEILDEASIAKSILPTAPLSLAVFRRRGPNSLRVTSLSPYDDKDWSGNGSCSDRGISITTRIAVFWFAYDGQGWALANGRCWRDE